MSKVLDITRKGTWALGVSKLVSYINNTFNNDNLKIIKLYIRIKERCNYFMFR